MAIKVRSMPGVAENKDFRAQEYFFKSINSILGLAGERTIDVGSIAAGAVGTFTVEVVGARADMGMTVQIGPPSTINTGLVPWGFVSADDTVTVVLYNKTAGAIDPASGLYGVRVMP